MCWWLLRFGFVDFFLVAVLLYHFSPTNLEIVIIPRMRPDPMSERLDESTEKRGDTYKHYNILGGRTGRGTALEYNTTRQAAVTTGDPRGGPNGGVD